MTRLRTLLVLVVVIAAFALCAGCTIQVPGQPTPAPGVTVTAAPGTATPVATGTVPVTTARTVTATATRTVTATATRTATPTPTGTSAGPGTVSGAKWNDLDGDQRRDAGEPVLANWTILLTMQQNGPNWFEVARTVTGTDGAYSFTGLAEGHYRVFEVAQAGWTRTYPTNTEGMHNLVISNGRPSWTGQDFGNTGGTVTGTATATVSPTVTGTTTGTPTVTATATASSTATVMPTVTGTGGQVYYADVLTARNLAFDKATFTVPAGATVALTFINDDPGAQHNFALYTDSSASTPIFRGGAVTGQITTVYTFTAPGTPGTYFFRCDVHPATMTGLFVVT